MVDTKKKTNMPRDSHNDSEVNAFKSKVSLGQSSFEIQKLKHETLALVSNKKEMELGELKRSFNIQSIAARNLKAEIMKLEEREEILGREILEKSTELEKNKKILEYQNSRVLELQSNLYDCNQIKVRLAGELESSRHSGADKQKSVNNLEAKLSLEQESVNKLSLQKKILEDRIAEYESRYQVLMTQLQGHKETSDKLQVEINENQQEIVLASNKIATLEMECTQKNHDVETKTQSCNNLRNDLVRLYKDLSDKNYRHDMIQSKISELSHLIQTMSAEKDVKLCEMEKIESDAVNAKGKLEKYLATKEDLENQLRVLFKKIEKTQEITNAFEKDAYLYDLKCQELRSQIVEERARFDKSESYCQSLNQENTELKSKLAELRGTLENLQRDGVECRSQVELLSKKKTGFVAEIQKLESEIKTRSSELHGKKAESSALQESLEKLESAEQELSAQVVQLKGQVQVHSALNNDYENQIKLLNQKVGEFAAHSNSLHATLESISAEKVQLDGQSKDALRKAANYHSSLEVIDEVLGHQISSSRDSYSKQVDLMKQLTNSSLELKKNLDEKLQKTIALSDSIRSMKNEIEEKRAETNQITEKITEVNHVRPVLEKEIISLRTALSSARMGHTQALEENSRLQELESRLVVQVTECKSDLKTVESESELVNAKNQQVAEMIDSLNDKLDKLQTQYLENCKVINEQKKNALTLTADLTEVEQHTLELEAKIETQEALKVQNEHLLQVLTATSKSKLQILDEQLQKAKGNIEIIDSQNKQAEALGSLNENEVMPKMPAADMMTEEFESSNNENYGLNPDLKEKMLMLKNRLETKHFTFAISLVESDFGDHLLHDEVQIGIFEKVQDELVGLVTSALAINAEVLASINADHDQLRAALCFSGMGTVTNDMAKNLLVPSTRKLLEKFKSNGLSISFKIKVSASGMIEKLNILISMPLLSSYVAAKTNDLT
jgi:predicted RNase H-like nuclease (RuvC/YqgF family)